MAAAVSPDGRSLAIDLVGRLWILPARGGAAAAITPDLLEARQPAWSPDGRTIAFQGYDTDGAWHIFSIARDGTGLEAADERRLRRPRADLLARRPPPRLFLRPRRRRHDDLDDRRREPRAPRRVSSRDGWMPAWSPNDRGDCVRLERRGRQSARRPEAGAGCVGRGRGRTRASGDGRDGHGVPSAIAWSPDGRRLASVTGGEAGTQLTSTDATLTADAEDVFPFRPQWLSSRDLLYTADGVIKRRSVVGGPPATIPFTAKVTLKRDTYTIARRDLEPAGPQPVTGIVSPGRVAGRPVRRVHRGRRSVAAARRRIRRAADRRLVCRERSGVVARRTHAGVHERPRRPDERLGARPGDGPRSAGHASARRQRLGPGVVARTARTSRS